MSHTFSADSLIEAFGDQAYHRGVALVVESLKSGDKESCRQLSQANIELMRRGFHKHPQANPDPAATPPAHSEAKELSSQDQTTTEKDPAMHNHLEDK